MAKRRKKKEIDEWQKKNTDEMNLNDKKQQQQQNKRKIKNIIRSTNKMEIENDVFEKQTHLFNQKKKKQIKSIN